jgi:Txe/YoeB family toxin of toxin-antitoxin system
VNWKLDFSHKAKQDAKLVKKSNFAKTVSKLLDILETNPYQNPPPFEKLQPPNANKYSRRINVQHRLVYKTDDEKKLVTVLSMWTHYE